MWFRLVNEVLLTTWRSRLINTLFTQSAVITTSMHLLNLLGLLWRNCRWRTDIKINFIDTEASAELRMKERENVENRESFIKTTNVYCRATHSIMTMSCSLRGLMRSVLRMPLSVHEISSVPNTVLKCIQPVSICGTGNFSRFETWRVISPLCLPAAWHRPTM